jgi:hypothetical protein
MVLGVNPLYEVSDFVANKKINIDEIASSNLLSLKSYSP